MKRFRPLVLVLVALLPAAITFALVTWHLDAALTDFVPTFAFSIFNDETDYWREIATFKSAGFKGGYYVYNDVPQPVDLVRFGAHGPVFPMAYGSLARVLGWELYSPPLFNSLLIALALGAFALANRLTLRQLGALGLTVATFWPMLFFLPSCMQETFQQVLAVGLAGSIYPLVSAREPVSRRYALGVMGFIVLAAFARVTWALLLLPVAWLTFRPRTVGHALLLAGAVMVMAAIVAALSSLVTAPYSANFISELTDTLRESVLTGLKLVARHIWSNVRLMIQGLWLERVLRFQVIAGSLMALAVFGWRWWRARGQASPDPSFWQMHGETLLHLANLGMILTIVIVLYDVLGMRDFRVMGAHLWLSVLWLILRRRYRWVALLAVSQLLIGGIFIRTYQDFRWVQFNYERDRIAEFKASVSGLLIFDPDLDPWCNTLLVDSVLIHNLDLVLLTGIPNEIGLSYMVEPGPELPLESRYAMLLPIFRAPSWSTVYLPPPEFYEALNVRTLAVTQMGYLVENLDADCPPLELDSPAASPPGIETIFP